METDLLVLYASEIFLTNLNQQSPSLLQLQSLFDTKKTTLMGYRVATKVSCELALRIVLAFMIEKFASSSTSLSISNQLILSSAKSSAIAMSLTNPGNLSPLFRNDLLSTNFDSVAQNQAPTISSASIANVNVTFVINEKPAPNYRKKIEVWF